MANFIRIKGGSSSDLTRDMLINADGVLDVAKSTVASRMNIIYDYALTAANTIYVEVQFPGTYTVTDSDIKACKAAILESCQKPGAIPYFVSSDGSIPSATNGRSLAKLP